ncbi:AbgT family transporter [Streptomyces javensis]|uniref:AbgT family transporter n=1 Tax=Streptomyces javensis TaxID=114698 RepID=A0ABS0RBQ4_9ACTN|nr:AbgT family transporter [Streptomyces javensis]MBI0314823.1 AbgT family transporter [Streptomyces javensis]
MNRLFRALSALERAGNRLPHPFWLFWIFVALLGVLSAVLAGVGVSVTLPSTGDSVAVKSLLSLQGAKFAAESALDNFAGFAPLSVVVVVLLGVSVTEKSGLLTALLRVTIGRLPVRWLTFSIAFGSMIAHVMSDSAYIVMIPLGALAFRTVGRSPVLGLMVAYASTAIGFNASPLVTPADAVRSSLAAEAAHTVDPGYVITPVATYFFTAVSSVFLAAVIALTVDRVLARRPEFEPTPEDDEAADRLFNTTAHGEVPQHGGPAAEGPSSFTLSAVEKRAMRLTGAVLLLYVLAVSALLLPGSPFRGEGGSVVQSVVVVNIAVFISLLFAILGIVYGRQVGTIPSLSAVPSAMADGVRSFVPVIVLFFVVAQFLAYFTWTGISNVITVEGARLLKSLDAPHLIILLVIILAISGLNIIISSGSAMWSILAPVVVPLAMYIGLSPQAAMVSFMIGDSVTNTTPMNAYFVLALGFLQQFRKGAGIGTMLSFTVPVALAVLVSWSSFFALWYALGIPLGPGVPVR